MNPQAEATKSDLMEAFTRLYQEKPLPGITVKDVTTRAGYHRSTFYLHFRDIPDLLEAAEQELLDIASTKVLSVFLTGSVPSLDVLFASIRDIFSVNIDTLSLYMTKPGSLFPGKLKQIIIENIKRHLPDYTDETKQRMLEIAITYQISAVMGVMGYWLPRRDEISYEEIIAIVKEISGKGVYNVVVTPENL